jgi:hypothetical protein
VRVRGLGSITAAEERLRRQKIALLQHELAKHQQAARQIAAQLRALGDVTAPAAGWVNWSEILAALPTTFDARQVAALAGVTPQHVASILFGWKRRRMIVRVGRGEYRKRGRG